MRFKLANVQKIWQRFLYRDSVLLEAERQKTAHGFVAGWAEALLHLSEDDVFATFLQVFIHVLQVRKRYVYDCTLHIIHFKHRYTGKQYFAFNLGTVPWISFVRQPHDVVFIFQCMKMLAPVNDLDILGISLQFCCKFFIQIMYIPVGARAVLYFVKKFFYKIIRKLITI